MSVEQLCMVAMVLMFGGFLLGIWREASRWMREANEREARLWSAPFDTRDMEVANSDVLVRLGARARLHEMRREQRQAIVRTTSTEASFVDRMANSQTAPPSHFIYGVQSLGDPQGVRLQNMPMNAPSINGTNYHN